MTELFLKIINTSISASWVVLTVLILRLVLKKAPKWVNVLFWGVVAVRMVCPFSIESALSLIPSAETIPMNIETDATPAIDSGINAINSVINPVISDSFTPNPAASANPLQILIPLASILWITGMAVMLLYTAISYWRLCRKVYTAVIYKGNIFQSENVNSPFVLGIIKPRIYLPFNLDGHDLEHVVAHEQAHISRKDHWWKPLGFLLLTIHWFNPLMWVAYVLLCRDIELACDEKVIKELGDEQRADYSQALLICSINHRMISACPLAFGEVSVKKRVKAVLDYKRPAFWMIIAAMAACVVLAGCLLTNPIEPTIYDVSYQDGYTVSEQTEVDVTLSVSKASLPDAIYTSNGYEFDEGEVIAFQTWTTTIYLRKAMLSNESEDLLYFIFDFSFDIPNYGKLLSPYSCGDDGDLNDIMQLQNRDLRDSFTVYPEALKVRGYGPGTQVAFYVSVEACRDAADTMMFDVVCNEIVYFKNGFEEEAAKAITETTAPKETDKLIPGTTYISYQCLYMNPLSSYSVFGGDSGFK